MSKTVKKKKVSMPAEIGTVVVVEKIGQRFKAVTPPGLDLSSSVRAWSRKNAYEKNVALELIATKSGGYQWRAVDKSKFKVVTSRANKLPAADVAAPTHENQKTHEEIVGFIQSSPMNKPTNLVISDIKWKYLVRSTARGKNVLLTGPSGCGKTLATKCVQTIMDRPSFYFNLGATQDPRSTLIGNTHFKKEEGTYFSQSLFVTAISTPDAIILLDEISRAHPDAWNILMTVLDEGQRYLRLDEKDDSPTIQVAPGVTFIATANIGMEYTSTRVMDRALLDRFSIIEMEPLQQDAEYQLLCDMFPAVDQLMLKSIAEIAAHTRIEQQQEDPKVSTVISTRQSVEMASLMYDGFTLSEVATVCILPFYSPSGGLDSERTYMMQFIQKFIPDNDPSKTLWQTKTPDPTY